MPLIRPAWTPATIALMVGGFIVFAPAGLAMLAYIIWGERFHAWRENGGSIRDVMNTKMNSGKNSKWYREAKTARQGFNATGNMAFDDWRDSELNRLAEERRKLDEMRDEFDGYARELRRAKDKEEFDRFMAARHAAPKTKTVPDVKED
ncbi:MAG: DUF2852 domain-containing protein [Notoacmeibacter sp.]